MVFAMEAARQAIVDSGYLPATDEQRERTVSNYTVIKDANILFFDISLLGRLYRFRNWVYRRDLE